MKFLIAFAVAVACARADVSDSAATILKSSVDVSQNGFEYGYETSNNIYARASGVVKDPNAEYPTQEVTGQYGHVGPDGLKYDVTYVANENGFQPQGAHLPVPPATPDYVLQALQYIEAHPAPASQVFPPSAPAPQPQAFNPTSTPFFKSKPFGQLRF